MFIYYFAQADRSIGETKEILPFLLDGLSDSADIAYRHGEELRLRASAGNGQIAKTVRLHIGETVELRDEIVIPIAWEATGVPSLFPKMEAELILAPVSNSITQISFRGSYKPPLGTIGEVADHALFHRVAESTVKRFVDRLRDAIVGWPRVASINDLPHARAAGLP